jgi:hypothetical protein
MPECLARVLCAIALGALAAAVILFVREVSPGNELRLLAAFAGATVWLYIGLAILSDDPRSAGLSLATGAAVLPLAVVAIPMGASTLAASFALNMLWAMVHLGARWRSDEWQGFAVWWLTVNAVLFAGTLLPG